jgi:hypothetical protein
VTRSAPDLLCDAASLIEQRGADRDLPQERSMRRAVSAFNALTGRDLSETQGWLFMVVLKLSRALGGRFNQDDLLDCAAYVALALENELRATESHSEPLSPFGGHSDTPEIDEGQELLPGWSEEVLKTMVGMSREIVKGGDNGVINIYSGTRPDHA